MRKFISRNIIKVPLLIFSLSILIFPNFTNIYASSQKLIPIGKTTGIILHSKGIIVKDFSNEYGESPAKSAGIKIGDVIISINGRNVSNINDLSNVTDSKDESVWDVKVLRNNVDKTFRVKPIYDSKTDSYIIGIKAKDTLAGIGTITYIDPATGKYGALGHGIYDDTSPVEIFSKGSLIKSHVVDIEKGEKGDPGELIGKFDMSNNIGSVDNNTECGIFGNIIDVRKLCKENVLEIESSENVEPGKAYILSNVIGDKVEKFDIEIVKINHDSNDMRQMLIKITDNRLLSLTGGIVQGMSGSPIIQDEKLIGAVTHVMINEPTKGYGIFIENMLKAAG